MSFNSVYGSQIVTQEPVLRTENILPNHIPTFGTDGKMIDSGVDFNAANVINTTVSELQSLAQTSGLVPLATYHITNSQMGGSIYIKSVTNSTLETNGTWLRYTNLPSFGWIRLTAGTAGSVDTITVAGSNVMSSSVSFNTNLITTCQNVCTNINGYSSTSGWTAFPVTDTVVLIASTSGTAYNGNAVSGSATGITLGNSQNTVKGENPRLMSLEITYDIGLDKITSCYDPVLKNRIVTDPNEANAIKRIRNFRWGDIAYADNTADNSDFFDNFFTTDGCVIYNRMLRGGKMVNNLGKDWNYVYNNEVSGEFGSIQDNVLLGAFVGGAPQISQNITTGVISGNIFTGNGPAIYGNKIFSNASGSGIYSNIFSGSNVPQISHNILNGQGSDINQNTLASPRAYINNNILNSRECAIFNNQLNNNGSNEKGIRGNILSGFQSAISNNIINSTGEDSGIQDCVLTGRGSSISGNTIATTGGLRNGFFDNRFTGNGSGFTNNSITQHVSGLVFEGVNAKFDSLTFPDITIKNIHWTTDNRIVYDITRFGLSGGANNGDTGSDIYLSILPVAKMYPIRAVVEGNGLTSGGSAQINIGIETDDSDNILQSTAITSLNTVVYSYPDSFNGLTGTKNATAGKRIVAQVTTAALTGGDLHITAEFKVSIF